MSEIATIGAILGSLKTAAEIAKLIKDSGVSLEEAEIKLQIAELISALADAKIEVSEIQGELVDKDRLIAELKEELRVKASVVWEKPYYWTINGEERDGPFCQNCYDASGRLIRLQGGKSGLWHCQACEKTVKDSSYVPPQRRPRATRY